MARARNIKPGFFQNASLLELPAHARLLFIGLWTLADREGRLEDRPKQIRVALLPYDDVDVDSLLNMLAECDESFITRYEVDGKRYIQVNNFSKHQTPHCKEKASTIPPPYKSEHCTVQAPDKHSACTVQTPGLHPLNPDSLIPDTYIEDEEDACARANTTETPICQEQIFDGTPTDEDEYGNPLPDPEWKKVSDCYLQQIGMMRGGLSEEKLQTYTDDLGADVVCLAIEHANVHAQGPPMPYILKTLENWFSAGVRDVEAANAHLLDWQRKQAALIPRAQSPPDTGYSIYSVNLNE